MLAYTRQKNFSDNAQYNFRLNGVKMSADEIDFVELAVSCLRARKEIEYLKNFRAEILRSTEIFPLRIMSKPHLSELEIFLLGNIVALNLCRRKIFEVTADEFADFTEKIYDLLNREYAANFLDLRILDAIYLEHMLGADLPYLEGCQYDECRISDLKIFDKTKRAEVPVKNFVDFTQAESSLPTNRPFESNEYRFRKILSSVMANGYPCGDNHIIVYNDETTVRDGSRRIRCLYLLHGDIKIPILRLKFSFNHYSYSMLKKTRKAGEFRLCI